MQTWRLILDGRAEGAWNMAVDAAILEAHQAGECGPTLRLYGWCAPTVSLGRFQSDEDVSLDACEEYGVSLCRRPTGGRGVLHDDETTYSVVAGVRDGLPRGVKASYRLLCGALAASYRELGVAADLTARPHGQRGSGACYLHATQADLSLGAAKLSGSAQVWRHDSCLQHGSFVVTRDVRREAQVFRLCEQDEKRLADSTCTIREALGLRPSDDEITAAVVRGMMNELGVSPVQADLSSQESSRARQIMAEFQVRHSRA